MRAPTRALRSALALGVLLALPCPGAAHPLGNFSISHYSGLTVAPDAVTLRYLIDMAEIPTFQAMQEAAIPSEPADPGTVRYLDEMARTLARGLRLDVDGRRLDLVVQAREITFPPGAGDLPTLKVRIVYRASLASVPASGAHTLTYRDDNYPDRVGWKEIVASGAGGVALRDSSVPTQDRSRELAEYPTDLLDSPPQDVAARLTFTRPALASAEPRDRRPGVPGGVRRPDVAESGREAPRGQPARAPRPEEAAPGPPAPAPQPGEVQREPAGRESPPETARRRRDAFSDLVATKELGPGIVLAALAVAAVLGAFHALEPGHGKTIVAAYLVGARGTVWHAIVLGVVVTASHTAAVYLLGGVTFYASRHVVPERLYPWLGLASGLTVAGLGAVLFVRRYAGAGGHGHDHGHHHGHHHHHDHPHGHDHDHGHHHEATAEHTHDPPRAAVSLRELVVLGITGGIIPCPAALVVLLSALSLRRVGFGLLLIVAFSVGLALVLIAIGVLMVYARQLMGRFREESPLLTRWLPLTSSAVITVIGLAIAVQAFR